MKSSSSNPCSEGHTKARRKAHEELGQEARDCKCQKKRRGHAPGGRTAGGNTTSGSKGQNAPKDLHIGSKIPVPLSVTKKITKQYKPRNEEPILSLQAELELPETNERLDVLLEHPGAGETLSAEKQSWVDTKLDRIDELMRKLGLSYDDDKEKEEDEKQEDMVHLLWSN